MKYILDDFNWYRNSIFPEWVNNEHSYKIKNKTNERRDEPRMRVKKVIFNDPATIVYWFDGTKTVVKTNNEEFDPEKGLAMAISKKVLGNGYHKTFKHWIKED